MAVILDYSVFWGVLQGIVAVAVLLVGGGGNALKTVAVLTGGPFAVLSVAALIGLTVAFRRNESGHPSLLDKARSAIGDHGIGGPSEVLRREK